MILALKFLIDSKVPLFVFILHIVVTIYVTGIELFTLYFVGTILQSGATEKHEVNFIETYVAVELGSSFYSLFVLAVIIMIIAKVGLSALTGKITFWVWSNNYKMFYNAIISRQSDNAVNTDTDYIGMLSSKLEIISQSITMPLLSVLQSVLYIVILALYLLNNLSSEVIFFVIAVFIFFVSVIGFSRRKLSQISIETDSSYTLLNSNLISTITNRSYLWANQRDAHVFDELGRYISEIAHLKTSVFILSFLPKYILEALIFTVFIAIILYPELSDLLNIGLFLVVLRGLPHFQNIFHVWATVGAVAHMLSSFNSMINGNQRNGFERAHKFIFSNDGKITVNLDPEMYELHSINFLKGQVNLIYGDSGIGKSSLVSYLLGVLRTPHFSMAVDPLGPICTVSYCPQRAFLLETTVRDYFKIIASSELSDEDIHGFLKVCLLDERITDLAEKLEHNGSSFSGGELARLSIAVGLARSPDVLILDETLANINRLKKLQLLENIENLVDTIIIVTHDTDIIESGYYKIKMR